MKIRVNNREKILPENVSIAKMLEINNLKEKEGIALAINNDIIPKEEWENTILKDGDSIIIINPTCGG
ncbi:MAG: sulfur carrier protein ThiS [Bacteroidales bacterium]|jgi:sulfur carrier protein|nr:sulfur carrier protein ThiS [Bacteroidales bacterium]